MKMMIPKKRLLLIAILLTALFFRFQNIDWDSGFHLHPDERFLTMVGIAMKVPATLWEYLNPASSSMNPANVGYGFFVYGAFPVIITKLLAVFLNADTYNAFTILGRVITGLLDAVLVFFVYRTSLLLEREKIISEKVKYWAAFFYAIAVLPIQYAHFFTTDTFLNFFLFLSFYFALASYRKTSLMALAACGVFFGLAVASKINAVFIFPLLLFLLLVRPVRKKSYLESANILAVFLIVSYIVVRLSAPYYFESHDFFDIAPNSLFVQNLTALKSFEGKNVQYPPALQWVNTVPVLFPVLNMALFGLGLPVFVLLCLGIFRLVRYVLDNRKKREAMLMAMIFGWAILVFFYESIQFVKVMRYFLFLYPFFAILTGWGAEWAVHQVRIKKHIHAYAALIVLVIAWPLFFSSIYFFAHTRVTASAWIYKNIPDNSVLLSEYWDDALPISPQYPPPRIYRSEQLNVFDPDTPAKWDKIDKSLKGADYYILSSNRGWGTLPSIPERFPQSTSFYNGLFGGKKGYTLVKSFYPSYYLCNIFSFPCPRILSNWFDESFTVYDSPTVYIFKNTGKR